MNLDRIVRLEWAAVAAISLYAYWLTGTGWTLFLVLALAPDLAILGYLAGPRAGAFTYNLAHFVGWPALLIGYGAATYASPQGLTVLAIGLIWLAHIALDRALGYGLKRAMGFRDTHMGHIGHGS